MTKKDYELIAKAIRTTAIRTLNDSPIPLGQLKGIARVAFSIANELDMQEERFDIIKFLKACSYSENDILVMFRGHIMGE